jgi:16S rRNA (uracil1498-N3)-methyltransferase
MNPDLSPGADLPLLFLDPGAWGESHVRLSEAQWHYLARVLRLPAGAPFRVLDGLGMRWMARMPAPEGRSREAAISDPQPAPGELPGRITLVQAILKGDRQDWILQKATELGVHAIVPVLTERTVVRLEADRADRRMARWQEIIREAAEQCERGRLPVLLPPVRLMDSLPAEIDATEALWFGHPREAGIPSLREAIRASTGGLHRFFVGPEGGFSPSEEAWLRGRGVRPVSLGARILRAETACLAAVSLLASELEER